MTKQQIEKGNEILSYINIIEACQDCDASIMLSALDTKSEDYKKISEAIKNALHAEYQKLQRAFVDL